MSYVFALGFLLGLRHALDADHIAAVASMAARTGSARESLRLGLAALSFTIALPLRYCARFVTWGYNGIHAAVGVGTAALGAVIMAETATAAGRWIWS